MDSNKKRRHFLQGTAAMLPALHAQANSGWDGPVIDIHLHPRRQAGQCFAHNDGMGATQAVLLGRLADIERIKEEMNLRPGYFTYFVAADPVPPGNIEGLRKAVDAGAKGIGEMKNHTAADSAEMNRVYSMCGELDVPVLIHFQEVAHFAGEREWHPGFRQFDKILQRHPKTVFIGHADFFWANISAEVPRNIGYPEGKVKPGGLTDKWLADYPNLFGDISANSGNNALSRDPDFTRAFLERHRNKLLFGSDCGCRDGRGTGGSPLLARLKGKCTGRDTLELGRSMASPEVFRNIVWNNAVRLLKFPLQ